MVIEHAWLSKHSWNFALSQWLQKLTLKISSLQKVCFNKTGEIWLQLVLNTFKTYLITVYIAQKSIVLLGILKAIDHIFYVFFQDNDPTI